MALSRRAAGYGGLLVAVLVVAVGALTQWRPWLELQRQHVTATPSLGALFNRATVGLRDGQRACVAAIPLDPETASVQLVALSTAKRSPALDVALRGPGYAATARVPRFATGSDAIVTARLAPPRRVGVGTLCVRAVGGPVALVGSDEPRSQSPSTVSVDGRLVPGSEVSVTLLAAGTTTIVGELGRVARHASTLTGGAVPAWLAWLLLVGASLAIPLGTLTAFGLALADDRRRA